MQALQIRTRQESEEEGIEMGAAGAAEEVPGEGLADLVVEALVVVAQVEAGN